MATRVQVVLDEEEREQFRRQAKQEGLSLSAWLKKAGKERLASLAAKSRPQTPEELVQFFEACDRRELGKEPDWDEHRMVIEKSLSGGSSET